MMVTPIPNSSILPLPSTPELTGSSLSRMKLVLLCFRMMKLANAFQTSIKLSSTVVTTLIASLDNLDNILPSIITPYNNTDLCSIPSQKYIKRVFFSFASNKSPEPDVLPHLFYKSYWKITGKALTEVVQHFFKTGHLLKALNHTLIALIPKISHPSKVEQFKPLSLCNVTYKVISMLIVNKLKPFLSHIISPFPNGFC